MFFEKVLSYSGNIACFVISLTDGVITSLNLYGPDEVTFKQFYAAINEVALMYDFKNKEPKDHEEIHLAFGGMCKIESEKTKTFNTHFHWVGIANPTKAAILMSLLGNKIIKKKDIPQIVS